MTVTFEQNGLFARVYPRPHCEEGADDQDGGVVWERRDARLLDHRDGSVAFEQRNVEVPASWSQNATNILAQKYFRGALGTPAREWSLRQVVDRIVGTITRWGSGDGCFADESEAALFRADHSRLLYTQRAAFNSPVWFNIGVAGVPQQASACFILSVEDTMESILGWYAEEGRIFKGGSGAGVNLSHIRASCEALSGGGAASGPVSFMRGADASAGTIKSGGKTRRAAKMVVLDVDHPDIEDFIWCKAREERKSRALAAAGFDMGVDGADSDSVQYQNANNSVRVVDEFMQAAVDGGDWDLTARLDGTVIDRVPARSILRQMAEAAWECADPGVQFASTINHWNTAAATGPITASNPCSEYVHLNDSACNLASINLLSFLGDDGDFDVAGFRRAVQVVFAAQEILVGHADYPTPAIADTTRAFRQIGLGYANLGAMLMALGLPYDSDEGPGRGRGRHRAHDRRGLSRLRSPGRTPGTLRRIPRQPRAYAARARAAPQRHRLHRRGARAQRPARSRAAGLGRGLRAGRTPRRAQQPGPRCWAPPAPSGCSWTATPPASSPTSGWSSPSA